MYHLPAMPVMLLPLQGPAHFLKVVLLSTPTTFLPYSRHFLGYLVPQYLQLSSFLSILGSLWICGYIVVLCGSFACCLTMVKPFTSFTSLRTDFCTFHTSTLYTHSKTHSLVVHSIFCSMETSFRISSTIPLSCRPIMNYFLSKLSYS